MDRVVFMSDGLIPSSCCQTLMCSWAMHLTVNCLLIVYALLWVQNKAVWVVSMIGKSKLSLFTIHTSFISEAHYFQPFIDLGPGFFICLFDYSCEFEESLIQKKGRFFWTLLSGIAPDILAGADTMQIIGSGPPEPIVTWLIGMHVSADASSSIFPLALLALSEIIKKKTKMCWRVKQFCLVKVIQESDIWPCNIREQASHVWLF